MFEYEINSGISTEEISSYFAAMALSMDTEERKYYGDGWEVRLIVMPDAIHRSIVIPRTIIKFSGEQKTCEQLIRSYRRAFMRGGA